MPGLAGDILGDRDALVLGLVREHRAGDDVADRPDAGDLGAEFVVGLDLAALVGLEPGLVEREAVGVGLAADRDEDDVGFDGLGARRRRRARRSA